MDQKEITYEEKEEAKELTFDDAFVYLMEVKETFKDQLEKFDEFLQIVKDFRALRINYKDFSSRTKELLKGHRELILGLNTFIPKRYELTLPVEDAQQLEQGQKPECASERVKKIELGDRMDQKEITYEEKEAAKELTFHDGIAFHMEVKETFKDQRVKYDEFLRIGKDIRASRIDKKDFSSRMQELLKGHRELILGLNTFLPKEYELTLPVEDAPQLEQLQKPECASERVKKIKMRFGDDRDKEHESDGSSNCVESSSNSEPCPEIDKSSTTTASSNAKKVVSLISTKWLLI